MPVVEMRAITKRFGDLVANDCIDLDVEHKEIQALLGENGAGKTTLMKVLYGLYQPDEGEIVIEGESLRFKSPADAIARGVGYVSQHFSLVPTFTVAENIVLGYEGGGLVTRSQLQRTVTEAAERYGFKIRPNALVRNLSVGQQQRVEILKALYRNCRILILDEPTAVLTPQDIEGLFATLRKLQQHGLSVVIITHKLEEAMAISQRITVLRDGKVVGRERTADTNPSALARLMVGRATVTVTRNADHQVGDSAVLEVERLNVVDKRSVPLLQNVSFQVHASEVVGIAGVAGNGQHELVDVLTGMVAPNSGEVCVTGEPVPLGDPREFSRRKVGRIPEDRFTGIIGDLTVAQNLALEQIDDFSANGLLSHSSIRNNAERLIADFQIKARPGDRARTLSGGNLQKLILARTLSQDPQVVIAAQPTRGLDVGATEYVHQKLLEQKERGAGVLLVSEDLDEVMALSDRILVMYGGQIVGEFYAAEADVDTIGLMMAGSATRPYPLPLQH